MSTYVVQRGDYPIKITQKFVTNISRERELRAVNLQALDFFGQWKPLYVGQVLNIPTSWDVPNSGAVNPPLSDALPQDTPNTEGYTAKPGKLSNLPQRPANQPDVAKAIHDANDALIQAWKVVHPNQALTDNARFLALGHVWCESLFGQFVSMTGSNNWGAIQSTSGWLKSHAGQAGFGEFTHLDHHADGTPYHWGYRRYPNQFEAAKDYLYFIGGSGALPVLNGGNPDAFARYLYARHYYEGIGKDKEKIQQVYAGKIASSAGTIRANLSKPRPPGPLTPVPGVSSPSSSSGSLGTLLFLLGLGGLGYAAYSQRWFL